MLQVFPHLIHTGNADEVHEVDHVLHRNGENPRQGHAHDFGNAGVGAQGHHDAVVVGLEGLHAAVRHIGDDVVRRGVPGLNRRLHDLGDDALALQIPRDIAHDVNVGVVDRLHVLVDLEPPPLALEIAVTGKRAFLHAAGPLRGGEPGTGGWRTSPSSTRGCRRTRSPGCLRSR